MPGRNRHLDAIAPAARGIVQRRTDERDRQRTGAAVDQVLADLDAATEGTCACGCGEPITASSPSAYYASPECHQAWMSQHVDDPGEVYNRRDAADYAAADHGVQTLNEPGSIRVDTCGPGTGMPLHRGHLHVSFTAPEYRRRLIYGPGQFNHVLAYRRTCPACDTFMEPLIYDVVGEEEEQSIRLFGNPDEMIYLRGPRWEQECSACHAAIVGMVHVPVVDRTVAVGWTFELHTSFGRVRSTVSQIVLDRMDTETEQMAYVAETWAGMERDLGRFEREWRGRLNRVVIAPDLLTQIRNASLS